MVGQLVEKKDSICFDRPSTNKPDIVGRTFPQAPADLGEDFFPAKVSELIMAFAKLQWLDWNLGLMTTIGSGHKDALQAILLAVHKRSAVTIEAEAGEQTVHF